MLLMMHRFRGSYIWDGTFDRFEKPATGWMLPVFLGFVAGLLIDALLRWSSRTGGQPGPRKMGLVSIIAAIATSLWCISESKIFPTESAFALTRPYVLITLAVAGFVGMLFTTGETNNA